MKMGLIRTVLFGFTCFTLGYYMGGGFEDNNIEAEMKKTEYVRSAYYQTIDEKTMNNASKFGELEKNLTVYYQDKKHKMR
jgi:hypothetical protein